MLKHSFLLIYKWSYFSYVSKVGKLCFCHLVQIYDYLHKDLTSDLIKGVNFPRLFYLTFFFYLELEAFQLCPHLTLRNCCSSNFLLPKDRRDFEP